MRKIVFDAEFNGLKPTKMHCFSWYDYEDKKIQTTTDENVIRDLFLTDSWFIGHNIIEFDIPWLQKLIGVELGPNVELVDTLGMSWYLEPNRHRHGLEHWGEFFKIEKPIITDWEAQTYSSYVHRCETDVKINVKLWDYLWKKMSVLYDKSPNMPYVIKYINFKMECIKVAADNRWKLDVKQTQANLEKLEALKEEKVAKLKDAMPPVPKYKSRSKPKQMYRKDGALTSRGEAWLELLVMKDLPEDHEEPVDVFDRFEDPNPSSHEQVKDWLFKLGWEPKLYKQGASDSVPQISDDNKEICESVKRLRWKSEAVLELEGISVLDHRIGILKGFLKKVSEDGYVIAEVGGFTNTLRMRHKTVVNLPSVDADYGEYIRSCLIAPDGYELVGADMESLEDRTKRHYMMPHDPDYVREMSKEGYDPHLDLAVVAGMLSESDSKEYKQREEELKPIRQKAKKTNYTCTYGAGAKKIAESADIPLEEAKELHEAYWKRNWAIRKIASLIEPKVLSEYGDEMWIRNPVSGFYYSLRFEKDIFSTLNQGTASYVFDTWVNEIFKQQGERRTLIGQFHDEVVLLAKRGNRDLIREIMQTTIDNTNKKLNLNVPMGIEVKFGNNYAEVH